MESTGTIWKKFWQQTLPSYDLISPKLHIIILVLFQVTVFHLKIMCKNIINKYSKGLYGNARSLPLQMTAQLILVWIRDFAHSLKIHHHCANPAWSGSVLQELRKSTNLFNFIWSLKLVWWELVNTITWKVFFLEWSGNFFRYQPLHNLQKLRSSWFRGISRSDD